MIKLIEDEKLIITLRTISMNNYLKLSIGKKRHIKIELRLISFNFF